MLGSKKTTTHPFIGTPLAIPRSPTMKGIPNDGLLVKVFLGVFQFGVLVHNLRLEKSKNIPQEFASVRPWKWGPFSEVWRFLLETTIFRGELLVSGRVYSPKWWSYGDLPSY